MMVKARVFPSAETGCQQRSGRRTPALRTFALSGGYGQIPVLEEVDIEVQYGEVVALLGANGAGKTTTLLALAGEVSPTKGHVEIDGSRTNAPLHRRAAAGMRLITEDRGVFMSLSVADNLRLSLDSLEPALELFPELRPLLKRRVGLLSGGEQQMLTLARALAGGARILLVDELSLGLAPLIVRRLLRAVRDAADSGVAVLLVEQQIRNALTFADRAYVLKQGRVVLHGAAKEMTERIGEIEELYLAGNLEKSATSAQ